MVMRFGFIGAGYFAPYQLAAWRELGLARCVAICNRTRHRAQALADQFAIPHVYDDPAVMLGEQQLNFIDIATAPETHSALVRLIADRGLPAICQKPLAPRLSEAEALVAYCAQRGAPLYVHENWRWQRPLRAVRARLAEGVIGAPFRVHLLYCNDYPVLAAQPALRQAERFIISDLGSHLLDTARFLCGEMRTIYCQTARVQSNLRGEDVATIMMRSERDVMVAVELSYASRWEHGCLGQTLVHIEGEHGAIALWPDFRLTITTATSVVSETVPPPVYPWAQPARAAIHAAIVDCQRNLLGAIMGCERAETSGADNLETVRLVEAAYASAANDCIIRIDPHTLI
jgi:predicted dehydrogenase